MKPYYEDAAVTVYHGKSEKILPLLADASVDAMVTDPPAGIAFMGRTWDANKGGRRQWIAWLTDVMEQAYRVLKPGGHALVWALPRTSHWTATALEDAGFEIRDCIVHIYGSGFPKSLDVGKAIDRQRNDRDVIVGVTAFVRQARLSSGVTIAEIDAAFGTNGMAWRWSTVKESPAVPNWEQWLKLKGLLKFGDDMDVDVWRLNGRKGQPGDAWAAREVIGERTTGIGTGRGAVAYIGDSEDRALTAAATETSKQWEGWGTALKPGQEHWWLIRKPLVGTVANTVLTYGTGALNIDACRTAGEKVRTTRNTALGVMNDDGWQPTPAVFESHDEGRWPTNLVLSHSAGCAEGQVCEADCPVGELDRQSGVRRSGGDVSGNEPSTRFTDTYSEIKARVPFTKHRDEGGASRFYPTFRYQAKAPASERPKVGGVAHPTTKSLNLMRWMCRLIAPPAGVVLDPFAGSGTTLEAALAEGFHAIGVEQEADYLPLIMHRLSKDLQLPIL
ncbi:site-specific DNA-methyltransferase [Streptosporangium sp. NBC_01810]|uniref:DNA methyltransferase n=1 Tax=Streptosporangium sp. NBC_01810 TaxID=2975951 RepID=UPI002DDC082E|nr:DNA methyltransferase [Streptosporangium sp. NBC_01810]WSA23761.1 site-specific DNA-methyltransferase [Streptosporangium sp. NBC_01810]